MDAVPSYDEVVSDPKAEASPCMLLASALIITCAVISVGIIGNFIPSFRSLIHGKET